MRPSTSVRVESVDGFARDAKVREEVPRSPRVLGQDSLARAQRLERTHRQVSEVADRRRDEEQRAGHSVFAGNVYCTIKD